MQYLILDKGINIMIVQSRLRLSSQNYTYDLQYNEDILTVISKWY